MSTTVFMGEITGLPLGGEAKLEPSPQGELIGFPSGTPSAGSLSQSAAQNLCFIGGSHCKAPAWVDFPGFWFLPDVQGLEVGSEPGHPGEPTAPAQPRCALLTLHLVL